MSTVCAILPMRAGSQRVIGKNVRQIGNLPLYAYIIDTLLKTASIGTIAITTDIEEVLSKYDNDEYPRITLLERPEDLRGNCSMNYVLKNVLERVPDEHFIQVHATNPLVKVVTIESAIQKYFSTLGDNDSVFSVTRTQKRFWNESALPVNHDPDSAPTTQDLPVWYEENSCFYIFSRSVFQEKDNRIGYKPYLYEISNLEAIDIDTEDEFQLVEKVIGK